MNNINFTGIKNTGFLHVQVQSPKTQKKYDRNYFIAQLTDDYKNNDLTEFKNVVEQCQPELGKCSFKYDSSFVHIFTQKQKGKNIPRLFVNGVKIPLCKNTMPMFSYIAKLTRKISNFDNKDIEINRCFKYGPDGDEFLLVQTGFSEIVGYDSNKLELLLEHVYSPLSTKAGAKIINSDIHKQMEAYLA